MHKLLPCVNRGNRQSLTPALDPTCKSESEQPANDTSISNIVRRTKFPEFKSMFICNRLTLAIKFKLRQEM
jgi:hypothetical protein